MQCTAPEVSSVAQACVCLSVSVCVLPLKVLSTSKPVQDKVFFLQKGKVSVSVSAYQQTGAYLGRMQEGRKYNTHQLPAPPPANNELFQGAHSRTSQVGLWGSGWGGAQCWMERDCPGEAEGHPGARGFCLHGGRPRTRLHQLPHPCCSTGRPVTRPRTSVAGSWGSRAGTQSVPRIPWSWRWCQQRGSGTGCAGQ